MSTTKPILLQTFAVLGLLGCGVVENAPMAQPLNPPLENCQSLPFYKAEEDVQVELNNMPRCESCIAKYGDPSKCGKIVMAVSVCLQNSKISVVTKTDYRVVGTLVTTRYFGPSFLYGELEKFGAPVCVEGTEPNCGGKVLRTLYCK